MTRSGRLAATEFDEFSVTGKSNLSFRRLGVLMDDRAKMPMAFASSAIVKSEDGLLARNGEFSAYNVFCKMFPPVRNLNVL